MDDMDFTKPLPAASAVASAPFKAVQSRFYDKTTAEAIFRAAGREEHFEPGQTLFVEDDRTKGLFKSASRMYFLVRGDVALTIGSRPLDTVHAGEIIGEMAVISGRPRSATATAKSQCVALGLDAAELQGAIGLHPEFALMLASVMYDRLRFVAALLAARPRPPGTAAREASVFEPELVARLEAALPHGALLRYPREAIIMKEGQAGKFMYLVKSGRVAIAVGSTVVEVVGPGGTFGEMAVVDQSPRTARAGALEECELLSIDRATLIALVKAQPSFGMAMLRGVVERLRHMNSQLA